ncbi:Sas10/Utp3/C1D family-domain-containing protein [Rhypophila decipiens]|uniref:Exosome complex protein n=1 Tax=Rhypophila decipiens TaxID=261697 RepID=A0AAN6XXW1_9PEZI|nr:Sas10/Utp3/C1D family-domain-containing protein [Rhypophila decipiens]
MDVTDITPQLEQLDIDLDQLEAALQPLLGDIGDISSRLPLLDKAKLNVLVAYAIESVLFSSLRLNGVDAKNHVIFTELTRVRQYVEKIKKVETPAPERENTLNTEAAIRVLRSDLADNKEVKAQLTEQIAKERAKAAILAAKAEKQRLADDGSDASKPSKRSRKATSQSIPFLPLVEQEQEKIANNPSKMPRQSRSSGRAPARPSVPARQSAPPTQQQQTRPATTYAPSSAAAPNAPAAPVAAPSQGPGLFGQMASTAAGVAVGSSIGHAIGGFFGGGSSAPAEPAQAQPVAAQQTNNQSWGNNCAGATQSFTKCMDDNSGNMQICGWYLEQLKACQAAASQY